MDGVHTVLTLGVAGVHIDSFVSAAIMNTLRDRVLKDKIDPTEAENTPKNWHGIF
jgi:hypothetical protein